MTLDDFANYTDDKVVNFNGNLVPVDGTGWADPDCGFSINGATADGLNEFMFGGGPARRFVADMGPVSVNAQQMIAGGQSGIVTEPNYGQALVLWLTNTYHPMTLGEAYAAGAAVKITTFGPAAAAQEN